MYLGFMKVFLLALAIFQLKAFTCRVLETMRVIDDEICYRAKECKYL